MFKRPDKPKVEVPPTDANAALVEAIQKGFAALPAQIGQIVGRAVDDAIKGNMPTREAEPEAPPPKATGPTDSEIDGMAPSQLSKYILSQVGAVVQNAVQPVARRVETNEIQGQREGLQAKLNSMLGDKAAYPHMEKMGEMMKKVAAGNKALLMNPEDLYHVTAARHKDQLSQWDKEASAAAQTQEAQLNRRPEASAKVVPFGGFQPSPKPTMAKDRTDLEPSEAFDQAWDQFVGASDQITAGA